jgi:hypothetical protein
MEKGSSIRVRQWLKALVNKPESDEQVTQSHSAGYAKSISNNDVLLVFLYLGPQRLLFSSAINYEYNETIRTSM